MVERAWTYKDVHPPHDKTASLSGRVLFQGKPLPHTLVLAIPDRAEGNGDSVAQATTDAKGAFHVEHLATDSWTLCAEAPGAELAVASRQIQGRASFDFLLTPAQTLHGKVLGSAGESVTGIPVRLFSSVKELFHEVRTDSSGQFTFEHVPVGEFQLRAGLATDEVVEQSIDVSAGSSPTVELQLHRPEVASRLRVHVLGESGQPRAGVDVKLDNGVFGRTGPDGTWTVEGLPTEESLVATVNVQPMPVKSPVLELPWSGETTLHVPDGEITVTYALPRGATPFVELEDEHGAVLLKPYEVHTEGNQAEARFRYLHLGHWTVRERAGETFGHVMVDLAPDERRSVTVPLSSPPEGGPSISGRVVDQSGEPRDSIAIEACTWRPSFAHTERWNFCTTTHTGADGHFEIKNVQRDHLALRIEGTEPENRDIFIHMKAGTTELGDILLPLNDESCAEKPTGAACLVLAEWKEPRFAWPGFRTEHFVGGRVVKGVEETCYLNGGLEADDVIVSVNGLPAGELDAREVDALVSGPGETVLAVLKHETHKRTELRIPARVKLWKK